MVVRRAKKSRRPRSRTRSWGFGKRHRGKGNRGGAGESGTGKRGQHNVSYYYAKGIKPLGRHGIRVSRRDIKKDIAINIGDLDVQLDRLATQNKIKKEGSTYLVTLSAIGYDKVLGSGEVAHKIKLTGKASAGAIEKIKAAGGEVTG